MKRGMNTHGGRRNNRKTSKSRRGRRSGVHFDSSRPEEDNNLLVDCAENFTSSEFDQNCPAKDGEDASQMLSHYTPFSSPLCRTTENNSNTTTSDPLTPLCLNETVSNTAGPHLKNRVGENDGMMEFTMEAQPPLVCHGNNQDEMYKYLDSLCQRSQYHINERFESMKKSINERLEGLQDLIERRFSRIFDLIKKNGLSAPANVIQLNTTQSKGDYQVFGHPLDVSKYRKAKLKGEKECLNSPDMSGASCSTFPTIQFNEVQSDSRSYRRRQASGDTCCNLCLSSSRRHRHSTPARRVTKNKVGTLLARRPRRNNSNNSTMAVKKKRPKNIRVQVRSSARQTKRTVFRSPKLAKRSKKITSVYRRNKSALGKQSRLAARNKTSNKYGKTRSTGSSAKGSSQRGKAKRKTNAPKRRITKFVVTPLGHKATYDNLLAQHERLKRLRFQHSHSRNVGEFDKLVVDAFRRVISEFLRNKIQKLETIILRAQIRSRKKHNRKWLSPARQHRGCGDRQTRVNITKSNAAESLQGNCVGKHNPMMAHYEYLNQSHVPCRQYTAQPIPDRDEDEADTRVARTSPQRSTHPRRVDSLCLIRKQLLRHQDKTTNATLDIPECLPCLFPAVGDYHSMINKTKFSGGLSNARDPCSIRSSESHTDMRNLPPYISVSSSSSSEYFSCEEDVSRVDCTSRGDVESSGHLTMESGQVLGPETVECNTVQGSSGATDDRASETHSTVGDSTAEALNNEDNVVIHLSTDSKKSIALINVSNQKLNTFPQPSINLNSQKREIEPPGVAPNQGIDRTALGMMTSFWPRAVRLKIFSKQRGGKVNLMTKMTPAVSIKKQQHRSDQRTNTKKVCHNTRQISSSLAFQRTRPRLKIPRLNLSPSHQV
ncbi:uncharacterized protein LOC131932102 isoform X2 [Physella acuta]|nr:uncharacterized protein LOC131932102 isoform X2 [Physella acuta]